MHQPPYSVSGAAKVGCNQNLVYVGFRAEFLISLALLIGTVHAWHLDVNVTSQRESLSKNASVLLDNSRSSAKIRVGAAVVGASALVASEGQTGGAIAIINEKGRLEVTVVCGGSTTPKFPPRYLYIKFVHSRCFVNLMRLNRNILSKNK